MEEKSIKIFNNAYWFSCLLNIGIGIGSWVVSFFSETPSYTEELTDMGYGAIVHLEQYVSYINLNCFVICLCLLTQIVAIIKLKRAGIVIKVKRNTTLISSVLLAVPVVVYWGVVLFMFSQIEWR